MIFGVRSATAVVTVALLLFASTSSAAGGAQISGSVTTEGTYYINEPLFQEQERHDSSISAEPEFYYEWQGGSSFTFTPFARIDSADEERTHQDIRELNVLYLGDGWEVKTGISKVFWGTTEFVHLVDVINQTDTVENLDGEDRLGQPMIHFSVPADWGTIDLFALPYFRERTFSGLGGRLRAPLEIRSDEATYESNDRERHLDLAVRYSHSIGDWEIGLSHFSGTNREPLLLPTVTATGEVYLTPYYELVEQSGLELVLVAGEWLLKAEAIYRQTDGKKYSQADAGVEYSFYGIFGSAADITAIVEYIYDSRGADSQNPLQSDLVLGLRLAMNDAASTEFLAGLYQDTGSTARGFRLEGSKRIGESTKLSLESSAFLDAPEDDPFYSLRDDAYLRLEAAYFF